MFATNFDNEFNDLADDAFNQEPRNGNGRLQGDERLIVSFYTRPTLNSGKSVEAGRPIYDETDFIKILIPGDAHNQVDNYASDAYKRRFPIDWEKYINKQGSKHEGTPLEHWKGVTVGQVAEFKAVHVFTVEDLIDLSDANSAKFPGIIALKAKAKQFIDASKEEAISTKAAETNARLQQLELERNTKDVEVELLKRQVAELLKANSEPAKPTKKASE